MLFYQAMLENKNSSQLFKKQNQLDFGFYDI